MKTIRYAVFAATCTLAAAAAGAVAAQSTVYTTPNTTTATGSQSVSLNGKTFTNHGLVGVGRLSATARDFAGETLGSFSGMALELGSWRRRSDGTYTGKMFTLPDRGPNDVGPFIGTTDYRNRVHTSDIAFSAYTGATNLPASVTSQNQLVITPTGGFLLQDSTGLNFTGKDAGANVITRNGIQYPSPATGEGAGKISLDSEAITFLADGSFYISDEYAAGIYYFDKSGKQIGAIQAIPALLPRTAGVVNFNGATAPTTGRRNNQGLEALSVTPDGQKLVTILQSAAIQDTGTGNQGRNNTRILVYDISKTRTPATPVEEYVLQLPVLNSAGVGAAPNATAAQSEMLALNNNQFLVLSRDGVGRGSSANTANSPVYKSVLLVDTSSATNIAGTAFETSATGAVSPGGVLDPSIRPVQQVQLVNMLNPVQLAKFGMNLNTAPSNILSISEKWEAMGLVPTLEEGAPQDFLLLVGNDNDFVSANGRINGQDFDASLSGAGGTGNNDSLILVYRLTLPTYVDPMALAALKAATPAIMAYSGATAAEMGSAAATSGFEQIRAARRLGALGGPQTLGPQVWVQGAFDTYRPDAAAGLGSLSADAPGIALGVDWAMGQRFRLGAATAWTSLEGDIGQGYALEGDALSFSLYGDFVDPSGLYLQGAFGWSGATNFDALSRPGAYGQTARGEAHGQVVDLRGEAGWTMDLGGLRIGPYLGAQLTLAEIDGYTETGASLSNAVIPKHDFNRTRYSAGIEASGRFGSVIPALRVGYVSENDDGDPTVVRLASADHAMGTQVLTLPSLAQDYVAAELGLNGEMGGFGWRVGVEARFTDETSTRVSMALAKRF